MLETTLSDVGHAFRMLRKSPVFTNFFSVLGVRPALGRFFLPEEDGAPLAHPVVVVSEGFWRTRLGADSAIVGQTVNVNGRPYTLVGVAQAGFHGVVTPIVADAWVPLAMQPHLRPNRSLEKPDATWLWLFGRMKDGVGEDAARAELIAITVAQEMERSAASAARAATEVGLYGIVAYSVSGRTRELGIRMALGARRGDVLRMIVREGMWLAGLGVLAGLLLAVVATRLMAGLLLDVDPVDLPTFAGMSAVFIAVALIASYLPARRAAGSDPVIALRAE